MPWRSCLCRMRQQSSFGYCSLGAVPSLWPPCELTPPNERHTGIWLLRLIVGSMWRQQSLWKIPPNYDGLIYWMKQMVDHASTTLQAQLVQNIVLFGPLVYAVEVLL
jgi:hypothetical protein